MGRLPGPRAEVQSIVRVSRLVRQVPANESRGIPPNDPGAFAPYSSPTVRLTDGSYVMDSIKIAEKLESVYPSPSLHLDTELHVEAGKLSGSVVFAVFADFMAPVVDDWLQEPSKSWFIEDRKRRLGMDVWELERSKGGERAWPGAVEKLRELQAFLRDHKKDEGPFVLGSAVSYADLVIIALFESLKRVRKDAYEKIMAFDQDFKKLHEAGKKWTEKDD